MYLLSIFPRGKKKYLEEYTKFEFISLLNQSVKETQCVLCNVVLSAESTKPSKLKHHSKTKHFQHAKNDAAFSQRRETGLKHQRRHTTKSLHQENVKNAACLRNPSNVLSNRFPFTKRHF